MAAAGRAVLPRLPSMTDRESLGMTLRFLATGAANTAVGFATIVLAKEWAGVNEYRANALGYAAGLLFGFWLNRNWTFESRTSVRGTAPRYFLAFVLSYASNIAVLYLGIEWMHLHPNLAQVIALTSYSVIFFLLCRHFVFRS